MLQEAFWSLSCAKTDIHDGISKAPTRIGRRLSHQSAVYRGSPDAVDWFGSEDGVGHVADGPQGDSEDTRNVLVSRALARSEQDMAVTVFVSLVGNSSADHESDVLAADISDTSCFGEFHSIGHFHTPY